MIVIRIPGTVDRNQLKSLLSMSRQGRSGQLTLTDGKTNYYLAIIENAETALTFQVALSALGINSEELNSAQIAGLRIRTTSGGTVSGGTNPLRVRLQQDPDVYEALKAHVLRTLGPTDLFGFPRNA